MRNYIRNIGDKVLGGEKITLPEAVKLLEVEKNELVDLMAVSNQVRHRFCGDQVDLCTLLNAKSGRCSEDCKFCGQSAHFQGDCATYPLLEVEEIVRTLSSEKPSPPQKFTMDLPIKFQHAREILNKKLNARVDLKVNSRGNGTIIISFNSDEDFNRILSKIEA